MSIPKGYAQYKCEGCGEHRWEVAVGAYSDQVALVCSSCESVVHLTAVGSELEFEGDF